MKYILIFLFSVSIAFAAGTFDADVEIKVKGLVCPSCAIGLKNSFKKHIKVKGLKIDTRKGVLFLQYWSEEIPSSEIKEMVKDSGYEAYSIKKIKNI
jgi:copper chaperone CopZ